ncbi:hypothetical protein BpHYR1_026318 [Brachionus plicatilis]|uniref:Uncharacterized protein n=1 Tax=Brachionus plicatilis TaxID=10195 RepID=A0A3M7QRZ6_BRAPC|nr:hypothetical protein BpHYR1_026318 [Brachionus plicatilis]
MERSESFNNLNPNQNNDNGSTTSNTAYNLISSINTNTTHIADSTTASGSSLTTSTSNSPNNDNQQQAYMDHLAQYNKIQNTLARGQFIDPRYANTSQLIDNQMNILPTQTQLAGQPTAAFLVQTPNGSALLIPPSNNFHTLNSFSLSRQNYLTTSPSVTSGTFRPESNQSQNVYQTIDAEKNGYLYPIDGAYDSGTTFTNTCSTRSKFKKSLQHQQQAHLAKLLENSHNNARSNSNGYFSSPTESSVSTRNRRHLNNSILERFKFGVSKKLEKKCSWKCLSFLFLIVILNLFLFTIYLTSE